MKRISLILIVLVLLGGLVFVANRFQASVNSNGNALRSDVAELRDLESVVTATGEVLPRLSSIVKSEISGRITTLRVEEGQRVKRDELLLELDRTSVEARLKEAERSAEADRLRLEKEERNFQRLAELFEKEFIGEKEYLDAETEYNLAKLNLEIAQARLDDAKEELAQTSILAPHDGIVTRIDIVEGEVISGATSVSNGSELMTVAELDALFLEANINEVDVERLSVGQAARLSFDAIPDYEILGKVDQIALSARKDGEVRVFPVEVVFESTDARVRPGISATVDLPIAAVERAVSVVLSSVFSKSGDHVVYRSVGDGWEEVPVEIGINNLQHVEVISGLAAGDEVALVRPPEYR